ncbi:TetR/AcrR family transcriptional regulator [Anaerosporobacter faecicola]|uniref:TetR/AcrR family transcriptional regulator n=1 Tax=Anaerosporobacter faecicola TaxID=2718714 RepID=UPI0014391763|nr:TetR/AcrR family transcriptional regulator [Anaerosporobacter faecicola]
MGVEKKYHHENLKQELIEAGIAIIGEEGERQLSLRKVAARCNVSQAAPYTHFQSKEDLIGGIQNYITDQFLTILHASQEGVEPYSDEAIFRLGEAYMQFFIEHPYYFRFMFQTPYMKIHISLEQSDDNFPPYEILRKLVLGNLERRKVPKESILHMLINIWATVQGITMLATQENVLYEGNWKEEVGNILRNQ